MKNYLKEEPTRNYDYAEAGGKPYIIIRNKDGSTTKLLIDKNAKYYNDLKRDVERSGTNFNKLRDDFIRRKEAQANSQQEPPKQEPPKQKPQKRDDGYGLNRNISKPGTPERNKLEAEIAAANKARREAESSNSTSSSSSTSVSYTHLTLPTICSV